MSQGRANYKDTLNLPKTSFDMKADLLAKEPALQQRWRMQDLYGRIRKAREGAKRFILHDGPPYANGNIHMGTALNKVLKDMVVRIKTMSGFDAPYVPGWDCHGLPIEQKVLDELGASAIDMPAMEIRLRCAEYAKKFAPLQSQQFQRLGVMGEFDRPYLTMDPDYEAAVLEVFARLVEQGVVYKQLRPVHWSIANRTALADAELEYHDRQDPSIYVAFKLAESSATKLPGKTGKDASLLIWTTTPWTLPANLAIAVHPEFPYVCVRLETADGPKTMFVAEGRLEAVVGAISAKRQGWIRSHEILGRLSGQEMVEAGLAYRHPLADRLCPVVPAEYVTLEDGTGLVHTAPGHGLEDYGTGLKHNLKIYCPVRADGTFDDTVAPWLVGKSVWEGNPLIVEYLRRQGNLLADDVVTHSYPHDWRSKTPTIFRATEQWFIAVDRPLSEGGRPLRELAMEACRRNARDGGVDFVPSWGRNRIAGMLESRPDWCISRQKAWGLPIPAFCNRQGGVLLTPDSVRAVARCIAKEGSDAWFTLPPARLLEGYDPRHDKRLKDSAAFEVGALTPGSDILDVWFESGSSWFAVALGRALVEDIPVDLYLEGSDQHRGWFQLSLLPALAARGKAPFKTVLTHGYVVDEEGRTKMSKSLGNVMDVMGQLQKRGADVLRLWVASQNYQDDVRCSDKLIAQSEDAYRKIRNTLRFCMGACSGFDPAANATEPHEHSLDLWMRMELHVLIQQVRAAYDAYEFHRAARLMHEFCTVQASSMYLSAVKDRLYCDAADSPRRRATQTVIHEMLMAMVKLLAPILPHTCEEAWEHIPNRPACEPDSVHLANLPDYDPAAVSLAEDLRPVTTDLASFATDRIEAGPAWIWQRLMGLRAAGLVKLEALRNSGVKNPLDAEVVFKVAAGKDPVAELLQTYVGELEDLLGVGYARVERGCPLPQGQAVVVEVLDSRGRYQRCERSWKRRPDVGSDKDYPALSARDATVMRQLKSKA